MIIRLRNRINHFILNRLLIIRYRARKNSCAVKCIMAVEILCAKSGLIFYGKNSPEAGSAESMKADDVQHYPVEHQTG